MILKRFFSIYEAQTADDAKTFGIYMTKMTNSVKFVQQTTSLRK